MVVLSVSGIGRPVPDCVNLCKQLFGRWATTDSPKIGVKPARRCDVFHGCAGCASPSLSLLGDGADLVRNVERFQFNEVIKTAAELSGGRAADTTPPTLISVTPANGATGVAPDVNIVAVFSESISRGTGTIKLLRTNGSDAVTVANGCPAWACHARATQGKAFAQPPSGSTTRR